MALDLEHLKEEYLIRAKKLISKYGILIIIYLRVSTKNEGQKEEDQLPMILDSFNLEKKQCLIIRAKESAFQLKKDNTRIFNIIKEIITYKEFSTIDKNLYVWHLNRIYRNREKLVKFGLDVKDNKAKIFSVRQNMLSECLKYPEPMNEIMYYLMLQLYGQAAQEESENKANDLKKSLHKENGRTYTNKNNLFGRKLKTITGKKITDIDFINKLEKAVLKKVSEGISYRDIVDLVKEKQKISISTAWITNLKKKYD